MLHFVLAVAAAPADTGSAAEYRGIDGNLRVAVPRIEASISVDGRLDEPVWRAAARLTGFSQYAPVDGRPAEQATEVLVWYAPDAIHFGVRAAARPGSVKATLADRDKLGDEDLVEFFLDTYHDGRQALVFGVNPLGVQRDGALAEGGSGSGGNSRESTDLSPDFVFQSKGRLTAAGYELEVRIPFKSIRYQSLDPQAWGLSVVRRSGGTGVEDSWTPARRGSPSFLGQAGTLEGLTGLRRGLVMDVNPFVVGFAEGSSGSAGWGYDRSAEVGANVRWGVTPNLTLNGTVNPDFSQVESDASQVVTDPRQALFFPEKRPFFLEAIEQFATPNTLIYTRRIVAPVGAAKLTGKVSGTDVASILAFDDPVTSASGSGNPFFAIARARRDLGEQSRLGLVYTGRFDGEYSNQVGGADARFVTGTWTLTAQGAGSVTRRNGETTVAPLWDVGVIRSGRRLGFRSTFKGISDEFVAGAGFIRRRGVTQLLFTPSYTFYGDQDAFLQRTTLSTTLLGTWHYRDFVEGRGLSDQQLFPVADLALKGGWNLNATLYIEQFGYDPALYTSYAVERTANGVPVDTVAFGPGEPINNLVPSITLETPRLGPLSLSANVNVGRDVNYYEWSPADILIASATAELRPTSQLRLDGTYIVQAYDRRSDATQVGVNHIPRLRLEYQITRAIFVRVVTEYNAFRRDALRDDGRTNDPVLILDPADGVYKRELAGAVEENLVRNQLLFSYQPMPGTVFFLGYGGNYVEENRFRFRGLDRTGDGFFLKASYLFRM